MYRMWDFIEPPSHFAPNSVQYDIHLSTIYLICAYVPQELVAQVTDVCRALSKTIPFRSAAITGGRPWRTQKKFLEEGVDIVIGTPQRILDHIREGTLCLDKCQNAVLDEVDVLLGGQRKHSCIYLTTII